MTHERLETSLTKRPTDGWGLVYETRLKSLRPTVAEIETREGGFANMSDEGVTDETYRLDSVESTTAGTEMETSGRGLAANKAMYRHLALPSLPVDNLDHSLSRRLHLGTHCGAFAGIVSRSLVPCILIAHVGESPFTGLDLGDRRP